MAAAAGAPMADVGEEPTRPAYQTLRDVLLAPGGRVPSGGGQKGGGIRREDEALVERAVSEGESAWDGVRVALNQMGDPARVLEIKNEILRRLANEDIDQRKGANGQSLFANYIRVLEITPDIINFRGEGGTTVLMYAAVNGRWKTIQLLGSPQLQTNPNIQNDAGETALMWAAAYNELSAVRELKNNFVASQPSAQPNPLALNYNLVDNLGWNALMVAAWCGHDLVVQQLAEKTNTNAVAADGRNAAKLAMDVNSPARIRGVTDKVLAILAKKNHPRTGGRKRTYRSKTKDKKRGTR